MHLTQPLASTCCYRTLPRISAAAAPTSTIPSITRGSLPPWVAVWCIVGSGVMLATPSRAAPGTFLWGLLTSSATEGLTWLRRELTRRWLFSGSYRRARFELQCCGGLCAGRINRAPLPRSFIGCDKWWRHLKMICRSGSSTSLLCYSASP